MFDKWKQTEFVRFLFFEWSRPQVPRGILSLAFFVSGEGVVEIGDGDHVPRVTGHGTGDDTVFVINEVGDDDLHRFLREFGDWGRTCDGWLHVRKREKPFDFGFGPVPKPVNEELVRYHSVNATRLSDRMGNDLSRRT